MQVMIVWEKDRPYFISDDEKGDCILLHFSLEYIDDVEISWERFFVYFEKDESTWKANIDKNLTDAYTHKSMIHELIAKINSALQAKASFDIIEYVVSNKESYAYFSYMVCWIEKYRPSPPGISRLVN